MPYQHCVKDNTSGTTATVANYKSVQQNYLIHHLCRLNTFVSCRKDLPFLSFFTIIKRECRLLRPLYILSLHFLFAQTLTPVPFQVKETSLRCLWSYQWLNNSSALTYIIAPYYMISSWRSRRKHHNSNTVNQEDCSTCVREGRHHSSSFIPNYLALTNT